MTLEDVVEMVDGMEKKMEGASFSDDYVQGWKDALLEVKAEIILRALKNKDSEEARHEVQL